MKRVFLIILLSLLSTSGAMASNVLDPKEKSQIKAVGTGYDPEIDVLITANRGFFDNPPSQTPQVCCDVLVDFLELFYKRREAVFMPLFQGHKDITFPDSLLHRIVTVVSGEVSQLFDMKEPYLVRKELYTFCDQHKLKSPDLIKQFRKVMLQLIKTILLKDQFDNSLTDILSTQGESGDIEKAVCQMERDEQKAGVAIERVLSNSLIESFPRLFDPEQRKANDVNASVLVNVDFFCGFDDFMNLKIVSALSQTDWTRRCLLFKYVESMHTLLIATQLDKEYAIANHIPAVLDSARALVANKFKPIKRVNSFGELGDTLEPAPPIMDIFTTDSPEMDIDLFDDMRDTVAKISWTNWTRTFFESFETVPIDEALEYLMIAADMAALSKQQFFEMFLRASGTTNIIDNLTYRDICVTFYKGEKLDSYSASRIGQKALNALAIKHLKERNVDIYDLLPFMRGFLLEKSVWDYMCKSFNEGMQVYEGTGSKLKAVLKSWRRLEEKEGKAYKNLEKLIDATQTNSPWKRVIAIPADRDKKSFTNLTMSCRNVFDNPLDLKTIHHWNTDAGDTPEKWTLLVAKFLHFRAATICLFAKELSGAFQGGRRAAVAPKAAAAPDKRLSSKRDQLQKKANRFPMVEQIDDEGQHLAINVRKGDKGLVVEAVTTAKPAAVVAKAQEAAPRQAAVTSVSKAQEEVLPPEAFREKLAAPQPVVEPESYYVGDLPMVDEVLLSWPKGKDRLTNEQENEVLIDHVVKLLAHYAKSRQAQARALFVAVGKDYKVQDTDFLVNIWETQKAARLNKAGDTAYIPIHFMAKASNLHEQLTAWTHANPDRILLLRFLCQDLVSKIYLLQVSARLVRHVKGLESVPETYFQKGASSLQMSEGLLASKALYKDVWSCYRHVLKDLLSHQPIRPGLLIHDDYLEQVEMALIIPGLDPAGPHNKEVVAGFEHLLGLRDKVLRAICSPEFKAYFDETREMRMLTFPDQDIAPLCVEYRVTKALQDARMVELQKVKDIARDALTRYVEADKKRLEAITALEAANEIENGYQKTLTDQEAKASAEIAGLKKQLEAERSAKEALQSQAKEMKRAHEEAKKAANVATKEKLAESAAVLREAQRALAQVSRTNKSRRIMDSKSRVQARLMEAAFADLRAVHQTLETEHGQTRKALSAAYVKVDESYHQLCSAKFEQEKTQLQLTKFLEERTNAKAILRAEKTAKAQAHQKLQEDFEASKTALAQSKQETEQLKQEQAAARQNHEEAVRKLQQELAKAGQELTSLQQSLQAAKEETAHWIEQNNGHFGKLQELGAAYNLACEDVEAVKKQCDEQWYARRAAEKELEALKQKPAEPVQANNPELEAKIGKLKEKLAAARDTIASLNTTIGLLQKRMK